MAKRKNALIAGSLSLLAFIVASPLDDVLLASFLGHVVLGLSLIESLLVGVVFGTAVFLLLEYHGEKG